MKLIKEFAILLVHVTSASLVLGIALATFFFPLLLMFYFLLTL